MSGGATWLYPDPKDTSGGFLMLPIDLLESPAFIKLSAAAKIFLVTIAAHAGTPHQRSLLKRILAEYRNAGYTELTDFEIENECRPPSKQKHTQGLFVIPSSHLERYGINPHRAYQLKKELIEAGFMSVAIGEKNRCQGWSKAVTVYKWSSSWRNKTQ